MLSALNKFIPVCSFGGKRLLRRVGCKVGLSAQSFSYKLLNAQLGAVPPASIVVVTYTSAVPSCHGLHCVDVAGAVLL